MKSFSRVKSVKVTCDRCKQIVEGIRGEEFSAGFYEMTKWEDYRRDNERYVCESCMFAVPKYLSVTALGFDLRLARLALSRARSVSRLERVAQPDYLLDNSRAHRITRLEGYHFTRKLVHTFFGRLIACGSNEWPELGQC